MIRRSGSDTPRSVTSSVPSMGGTTRGKKIWTPEEDENLKNLVAQHGTGNWTMVAQSLPERTGKQCRERWHNHLGSGIKKGDWTEEEDRIIITMQRHIGNQWAKITKMLPGRTDNAVKNRFHATERAKSRGKCDESLYNTALDDAYFEQLKKQHTDIDFDQLIEQHAKDVALGGTDGGSVDNTRTSSITGSDASSGRERAKHNSAVLTLGADQYLDEGAEDDELSDEEDEADHEGDHGDFPNVMNLADVGQLEDLDADPMHLMDIDIISFDSDDMNLDFEEGGGLHHAPDTRNVVGDSCCFSFDWGCSSYYKNVFNPATDKRNKVALPSSSQQGSNKRPAVVKKESSVHDHVNQQSSSNGNFYTLPPAPTGPIELHSIGANPAPTLGTGAGIGGMVSPQQFPAAPTAPVAANLQQAQMLYGQLPVAPVGQPAMVPANSALQYQQFLAHQQQLQMQQQQQYMVAYQQAMANPQQQQQFHQYQQQLQMQNQYLAQQQQQPQQAAMLAGGGYPQQQYGLHAQYAMHPGSGGGGSRPVSTSSYASSNNSHSRPVSSSSYGGTIGAGIGGSSY